MKIPLWMRIRIRESGRKKVNLYLPLFLLWLLLLPILILILPFLFIAAALTWRQGYGRKILGMIPFLTAVIFSLSGLHIEVDNPENQTLISIL